MKLTKPASDVFCVRITDRAYSIFLESTQDRVVYDYLCFIACTNMKSLSVTKTIIRIVMYDENIIYTRAMVMHDPANVMNVTYEP